VDGFEQLEDVRPPALDRCVPGAVGAYDDVLPNAHVPPGSDAESNGRTTSPVGNGLGSARNVIGPLSDRVDSPSTAQESALVAVIPWVGMNSSKNLSADAPCRAGARTRRVRRVTSRIPRAIPVAQRCADGGQQIDERRRLVLDVEHGR